MREGWEIRKLGDICNVSAGQGAPQGNDKYSSSGTPFVKAGDLSGLLQGQAEKDILQVSTDVIKSHRLKVYPAGAVLFAKSGMSCMKGYVYTLKHPCCVVSHLAILTPKRDSSSYLQYCLRHIKPNTLVKDPAYPSISLADISSLRIPLPPIAEQEKIVAELDCLTGILEKKQQQLEELDTLAQSIFYDMFGDPNVNDKHWRTLKFSETCKNLDYMRRPITAKDRVAGTIPYYGASGIVDWVKDFIFDGDFLLISEDGANLLMRHTPIAFPAKGKTWVNNHAHILQFEHLYEQSFMEHFINLMDISSLITGAAQPKLTQANLNSIDVFDIPVSSKVEFAQKIDAIEKQKALVKQSIVETETLFNSRMDYWFN